MKKWQKKQAEELLLQMEQAHGQIRKDIEQKHIFSAVALLEDCQNAGISLGTWIENAEGEGHPTVTLLEEYCELVYSLHERLSGREETAVNKIYKPLKQKLIRISNSIKNDIPIRVEAVFLPYKASMWDSLESVWQVADRDPNCDAYVIPIPYYDKNPDGSLGTMHYEADEYPDNVPITAYDEFDFGLHRPDMIFIHNPYDQINFVTSVHPFFYSDHLKQFTECLVYIPYYATAGGMNAAQAWCPAYVYADYIVIQSEKFKEYFDKSIPDEKFLVLGSPKFDSVIHKCQNPPAIPELWKDKMRGRKVYFYNTSINGMLGNTEIFLRKMKYVFDIFKGREDACLLWRPHPLLESTFDSMRKEYKQVYEALKTWFVNADIGILDETPDIENTIAVSDAYIGDVATSVTSLFGVAGKPLFILNNYIDTLPQKDDWRGERINLQFDMWGDDRYQVTNNKSFCLGSYKDEIWLMPMKGRTITRWNSKTGDVREYSSVPEGFKAVKWPFEYECEDHPFGNIVFFEENGRTAAIVSPSWGNMYFSLDIETGETEEWKPPMGTKTRGKNEYFPTGGMGGFIFTWEHLGKTDCRIWYAPERKLYDINLITKEYKEVEIEFDYDDLLEHEPGFMAESEGMQYCLWENAFNSLKDFLDGHITGNQFDKEKQLQSFARINANTDGTCGKNVYEFLKGKIS